MPSKKNIIVGAASLHIGPPGPAAAPAAAGTTSYRTTLASAVAPTGPWRDIGYTQDGLEIANDPTFDEVEVDQLLDVAKIFKSGMGLSISTTLAEATLENLLVAWGQATSTLTSTATEATFNIEGGSLGDAPIERGLIAIGNGTELDGSNKYKERTYHAYRVLSVEGSSHTLARADATVLPVTFRALPEDNGRYGIIRDRNNVA